MPRCNRDEVLAVQRTSSDLRLDPHAHAVSLDGVYLAAGAKEPRLTALPRPSSEEAADVLEDAVRRMTGDLQTRAAREEGDEGGPAGRLLATKTDRMGTDDDRRPGRTRFLREMSHFGPNFDLGRFFVLTNPVPVSKVRLPRRGEDAKERGLGP